MFVWSSHDCRDGGVVVCSGKTRRLEDFVVVVAVVAVVETCLLLNVAVVAVVETCLLLNVLRV